MLQIFNFLLFISMFRVLIKINFWNAVLNYEKAMSCGLTHLSLDNMTAISQMIFSDAFLWMKILYFD